MHGTIIDDTSEPTFVHIECECPHCDTHHALTVVEKLDGFCVQGKVPQVLWDKGTIAGLKAIGACLHTPRTERSWPHPPH